MIEPSKRDLDCFETIRANVVRRYRLAGLDGSANWWASARLHLCTREEAAAMPEGEALALAAGGAKVMSPGTLRLWVSYSEWVA